MSKNKTFKHIVSDRIRMCAGMAVVLVCLSVSCAKDTPSGKGGTGTLALTIDPVVSIDASIVKSVVAAAPSPSDFNVTITNEAGRVVYRGKAPTKFLQIPEDSYTIVAEHGDDPILGFDAPYFKGSETCEVKRGETVSATVKAAMANARTTVFCDPSLTQHLTVSSLTARVGDQTLAITADEPFFVRAGSTLQIELTGVNDLGKAVSLTKTVTVPLEARTEYAVHFKPISFTIPQPYAGDIWCKRAYVTPAAATDVSASANAVGIAAKIVYELSKDNGASWTPAADIDGRSGWQNLTPGTSYLVRGKYGNIVSDDTHTLTTAAETSIPNNTFGAYYETTVSKQPCYWFFANGAAEADKWWATRNEMTTSSGASARYTRYSGSRPSNPGVELVTCGWGNGNTAGGGSSYIYNISAGAIFLGSFGSNTEYHGKSFDSRPTAMSFQYKYAPYNNKNDRCIARIWLENRTGETTTKLAEGSFETGSTVSSYTTQTVSLTYLNDRLPITHLCIAFYSGVNEGTKGGNNNGDGYVKDPGFASNDPSRGSVMHVNDVQLIYDK